MGTSGSRTCNSQNTRSLCRGNTYSHNRNEIESCEPLGNQPLEKLRLSNKKQHSKRKRKKVIKSSKFVATSKPTIQYVVLRKPEDKYDNRTPLRKKTSFTQNKNNKKHFKSHKIPETLKETNEFHTDDQRQCPICLEKAYKNPRILPCHHTFCFPCLVDYTGMMSSRNVDNLVCPICRAKIPVLGGGIKAFLPNFFVVSDDVMKCDICRELNGKNILCSSCQKQICKSCQNRHKCVQNPRESGILAIFDHGDISDDSDSDSSTGSAVSIPYSFTRPAVGGWSKVLLKEVTKFHIGEDQLCVHIVQKLCDEMWLLIGTSESISVMKFKTDGTCLQNSRELSFTMNFAVEQSNSVLVPLFEEASLCRFTAEEDPSLILPLTIFYPFAIDLFPDGNILVAGCDKSNVDEIAMGCVKIVSPGGEELSSFTTGYSIVPTRVCILSDDLICLGFQENHFVDIRLRDGNVVGKYSGNNLDDDDSFQPYSICVSTYGKEPVVLASDCYTDTIHMITYSAEFIGLLMKFPTPHTSGLGQPGAITVSPSGEIWIAQRESNEITCYSICKYDNIMD